MSVASLISEAAEYWARNAFVDEAALTVTPPAAVTVTLPAPSWARSMDVPTAKPTVSSPERSG